MTLDVVPTTNFQGQRVKGQSHISIKKRYNSGMDIVEGQTW